jgi:hypothetical protein
MSCFRSIETPSPRADDHSLLSIMEVGGCMEWILRPWHLTVLALAGWMSDEQRKAVAYLQTENAILREKLGKKRILLNNDQRRRLAVKGKELGRKGLIELSSMFTPDSILRWHRELVARKWDYSANRGAVGRPRIRQEIIDTIVRLAKENQTWGYDRIQGALMNIGYRVSDGTVANVLKDHGIEPVPRRGAYIYDVEDLPSGPLARPGCDGLHNRRGLDAERLADVLRPRCDAFIQPAYPDLRRHAESERGLDATDRP